MGTEQRRESGTKHGDVVVSSSASNMVSSLHPFDRREATAVLRTIKSSVLDPSAVEEIAGVENAFVARAGQLRVIFKKVGESVVITSVVAQN